MSLLAAGFIIGVENGVEWGGASLGGGGASDVVLMGVQKVNGFGLGIPPMTPLIRKNPYQKCSCVLHQ